MDLLATHLSHAFSIHSFCHFADPEGGKGWRLGHRQYRLHIDQPAVRREMYSLRGESWPGTCVLYLEKQAEVESGEVHAHFTLQHFVVIFDYIFFSTSSVFSSSQIFKPGSSLMCFYQCQLVSACFLATIFKNKTFKELSQRFVVYNQNKNRARVVSCGTLVLLITMSEMHFWLLYQITKISMVIVKKCNNLMM